MEFYKIIYLLRHFLLTGYRLPQPENTPENMYRLMMKCWSFEPSQRPHFSEIYTVIDTLLANTANGNGMVPIKE